MKAPSSIAAIARRLIQDIELVSNTPEGVADFAIQGLSAAERESARQYLEKLLDGSTSVEVIEQIWSHLPSEIAFDDGNQLMEFLQILRGRLR